MNREALRMLLSSGRFLCFDAAEVYAELKAAEETEGAMFDSGTLNAGVLFKEVDRDEGEEEMRLTTRMYFPYDAARKFDGGESILATVESIQSMMMRRGILSGQDTLSDHDRDVLKVFDQIPTFDPFLLLSRRPDLEAVRGIDRRFFDIDEATWTGIRRPVMHKIGVLVEKAGLGKAPADDGAGEGTSTIAHAVLEAIWTGEPTPPVQAFIGSFRLDADRTREILFAWKGINYYEYLYRSMHDRFTDILRWLASDEALPRESIAMDKTQIARFHTQRDRCRTALIGHYQVVKKQLDGYETAFNRLVENDEPAAFQEFLGDAPRAFSEIGSAVGVLAHAGNSFKELTRDGRRRTVKAERLTPFFDFVNSFAGPGG